MPFVKGDFYPGHHEEAAGGEYFALRKLNEGGAPVDVRGIVIGSTYRRCSPKLAVAESSTAVAEYLMGEFECTRESRSSVEVFQSLLSFQQQ